MCNSGYAKRNVFYALTTTRDGIRPDHTKTGERTMLPGDFVIFSVCILTALVQQAQQARYLQRWVRLALGTVFCKMLLLRMENSKFRC